MAAPVKFHSLPYLSGSRSLLAERFILSSSSAFSLDLHEDRRATSHRRPWLEADREPRGLVTSRGRPPTVQPPVYVLAGRPTTNAHRPPGWLRPFKPLAN